MENAILSSFEIGSEVLVSPLMVVKHSKAFPIVLSTIELNCGDFKGNRLKH